MMGFVFLVWVWGAYRRLEEMSDIFLMGLCGLASLVLIG